MAVGRHIQASAITSLVMSFVTKSVLVFLLGHIAFVAIATMLFAVAL
jgi:hypothetical protein